MATRMQQRRSPAADWTTVNPILAAGEIGYEIDTNKFKMGDGVNHWSDLSYFDNADNIGGSLGDYIPLDQKGVSNGVATLDSTGNVPFSQLGNIIGGAPGVLDTLNEIAAALGDDADFLSGLNTSITNAQSNAQGYADTAISTHNSDTTSVHGIADTAELATKTFAADLLVNATKTNITITGDKTGLVITAENGVADSTTDNLSEGTTNKYFTDERAQDAVGLNVGDGLTYTDSTGEIKVTPNRFDPYGSATTAESSSKSYTDTAISTEVTNRNSAIATAKSQAVSTSESYTDTAISAEVTNRNSAIATAKSEAISTSEGYTDTAIANLVNSAPSTLDTLKEIADQLATDESAVTALTTVVGTKLSSSTAASTYAPLASPALTGTPTAPTATAGTNTTQVSTTAFVKTAIDALKTVDIEEDTNLYFTDQRAVDAVVYAMTHGLDLTLDGGTL